VPAPDRSLARKSLAEGIGTFALVFAGCGAVAVEASTGALGHGGVAATFGLVVCVMVYAVGHVSGAHFNPAVTVAFAATGRFPWREVPAYVLGQSASALLAAGVLRGLLGPEASLGVTGYSELATGGAFVLEGILTFGLMFVIVAVATDGRAASQMAGLAIGGTVCVGALFGGPLTGASMNPARSLGPALVSGELGQLWLYVAAPLLGAAAGAWTYGWIRCEVADVPTQVKGCC